MTSSGKLMLIAGALVAVAGSAFAQQQPTTPTAPQQQLSYSPGAAAATATADPSNPDHFAKPAGYDQNPAMYPYTRKGSGPKPN
jgi:hypothetical protein